MISSQNQNQILATFGQSPELDEGVIYYYIFIFNQQFITPQQRGRISSIRSQKYRQINLLGHSLDDFYRIKSVILRYKKKNASRRKIILVTDLAQFQDILIDKENQNNLKGIHEIFVCFPDERQQGKQFLQKYQKINKECHDLNKLITRAEQNFKNIRTSPKAFRNFRLLSGKGYKKDSYLFKVRANGCIHLQEKEYSYHLQLFKVHLSKYLAISPKERIKDYNIIIGDLQKAIQSLKNKKYQNFRETMLKLYQKQTIFYEILNKGLMEFTKQKFEWRSIALPYCLLYKAIKMEFASTQEAIQKLFGSKEFIILWRAGKISEFQLNQLKQIKEKRPFFELSAFTSTSLKKQVVLQKFLNNQDTTGNCLMKFKLKRPKTRQEIKNFQFIFQSFAIMNNKDKISQFQVLLNTLTVMQLQSIYEETYGGIKAINLKIKQRFQKIPSDMKIPLIQFEVGGFQHLLESYKENKGKLQGQVKDVIEHYLLTIDFMKNYQHFDIGDSLRLSGDLQASLDYDSLKIKQLQEEEQKSTTQEQIFLNRKKYHEVCERYADTCFDFGMEHESIVFSEISIRTYKLIQSMDEKRSLVQRHDYINKKYDKLAYKLQYFNQRQRACQLIMDRIKEIQSQMKKNKDSELACIFFIAKLYINLGMIWFRQGNVIKAKEYFDQSHQKIKKVKEEIDYDNLSSETFHISFILHYIYYTFADSTKILEKQSYVELKRTANIARATGIFGGTQKFRSVVKQSQTLKKKVDNFIIQNSVDVANQQDAKAIETNANLLKKVQQTFINDQQTLKLEQPLNEFFQQFTTSIKAIKKQEESRINIIQKDILNLIIETVNSNVEAIKDCDQKIFKLKDQLIEEKLNQWQTVDYKQKRTALSMKHYLDRHIITMKIQESKRLMKQNRENYQQYSRNIVFLIHKFHEDQQNFGYSNPTLQKIKQKLACEELLEDQGDESMAEQELQSIIQDAKSNKTFIVSLIEAYIRNAKLHYSIADIDFLDCLQKVPLMSKSEVKFMQTNMLNKCEQQLGEAESSINKFKKSHNDNQRESRTIKKSNQSESTLCRTKREAQQDHEGYQKTYLMQLGQKMKVNDINIKIQKVKCDLIKFSYAGQIQKRKIKSKIQQQLNNVRQSIDTLDRDKRKKLESIYLKVKGLYLYNCNQYDSSLQNFSESLLLLNNYEMLPQKAEILTKMSFLFCNKAIKHSSFSQQLFSLNDQFKNYPFYWRLCLAKHFQIKMEGRKNFIYIQSCINIMEELKKLGFDRNKYFTMKYQFINEFQYSYYRHMINNPSSQLLRGRSYMKKSSSISRRYTNDFSKMEKSMVIKPITRTNPIANKQNQIEKIKQFTPFDEIFEQYKPKAIEVVQQSELGSDQLNRLQEKSNHAQQYAGIPQLDQKAVSQKYSQYKNDKKTNKDLACNQQSKQLSYEDQMHFDQSPIARSLLIDQGLVSYYSQQLQASKLESKESTQMRTQSMNKISTLLQEQSRQLKRQRTLKPIQELSQYLNENKIGKIRIKSKQSLSSKKSNDLTQKRLEYARKKRQQVLRTSSPSPYISNLSNIYRQQSRQKFKQILSSSSQELPGPSEIKDKLKINFVVNRQQHNRKLYKQTSMKSSQTNTSKANHVRMKRRPSILNNPESFQDKI